MHDSLTIALLQAREAAMAYFRPIVKRHNLTEQQWRIVRILAERPSMDFHDLAFRACILRPSLTGILTRMERDGLVLRLKPVNDQRKLYVSLTPGRNCAVRKRPGGGGRNLSPAGGPVHHGKAAATDLPAGGVYCAWRPCRAR